MNEFAPINSEMRVALKAATEDANQWRGRCVNLFACAEVAVGAALAFRQPDKRLPMLVSQKVQRLRDFVEAPQSRERLDEFALLLVDRTALTHGAGRLWVSDGGKWLLTLDWSTARGPQQRTFSSDEAEAFHCRLRKVVRCIEADLRRN